MLKSTGRKMGKGALILAMSVMLSGCANSPVEGDDPVILEQEEQTNYTLVAVTVTDVLQTHRISCEYRQVNDEKLSFELDNKEIAKIYVEKGDTVVKGQLLAELVTESIDTDIENLQYQIKHNQLLLKHVNESQDMDIRMLNQQYAANEETEESKKAKEEALAAVRRQYRYQIEDYQDDLEVENMRLKNLQAEKAKAYLYAGMDGTVSYLKEGLEGSYSKAGEVILKVIDDSHSVFVSKETEYQDYFPDQKTFEMVISVGKGAGTYELVPYQRDAWGEEMYFTLADENEEIELEVGRTGNVTLKLDERNQVLAVPSDAVHEADKKSYVYVLGNGGVREVQWISTGLHGDSYVEITDGLKEGDKVILK